MQPKEFSGSQPTHHSASEGDRACDDFSETPSSGSQQIADSQHTFKQRIAPETTELQQAYSALAERETLYRTLAANIPNGSVVMFDRNLRYVLCEGDELAKVGLDAQAMVGKTIWEVFPAQLCEQIEPQYQATLTGETTIEEVSYRNQIYETRAVPIRNEQGEIFAGMILTQNVTQRRQAEAALRESENLYRILTEAMPQFVWSIRPDGTVDYVNQHWQTYTGQTPEQTNQLGWGAVVHPDDMPRLLGSWATMQAIDTPHQTELRCRNANGDYRWFIGRVAPLRDEQGRILKWIGTFTDIHDRKLAEQALQESEARLQTILDSIPAVIYLKDLNGRCLFVNRQFEKILNVSREQMIGQIEYDFLPQEVVEQVRATDRQVLQTGQSITFEETVMQAGAQRTYLTTKLLLKDSEGKPYAICGTSTDITDRTQLLAREQAARQQAEAANRVKDEFLAVLSHELRTPLNPILGWTKLLRSNRVAPDRIDPALETIERNAKLQVQLIDDLLDVSRILRGKLSLTVTPVKLAELIEAAIETVRLAAEAKNIQIQTSLDANVGTVSGDASRLQQVVWNLLSNAVKFTPNGGRVEVRLALIDANAEITVSDTGKGISPEFLPYVFDYFRQADSATTRQFGGLGLGLAIVRQIVELHGGTVWAESAGENQGATFTVRLPGLGEERGVRSEEREEKGLDSPRFLPLTGLRILAVDDEADSLELIAFVLSKAGAEVITAASAIEALQILDSSTFDVLVSDIGMPEMDGYALMREIKVRTIRKNKIVPALGETPIKAISAKRNCIAIALTAYAGELNEQQALNAGFQRHLAKPIDPDALVSMILALVQQ